MHRFVRNIIPLVLVLVLAAASAASGEGKQATLIAPAILHDSGLFKYLLPRFTLKHGIRVVLRPAGAAADLRLTFDLDDGGRRIFRMDGRAVALVQDNPSPHAARFAEWLASDVGLRTLSDFPGTPEITADLAPDATRDVVLPTGDRAAGEAMARKLCGRCHVVSDDDPLAGIGSTPSFAVLRALPGWQDRLASFFALKPHPAFTQVAEMTVPFPPERPPPIVAIRLSLADIDNIVAFVAGIPPADLGAPVQIQ